MTVVEVVSVAGVTVVGLGLIATWINNGRTQSKRDGVIEEKIKNFDKKLDVVTSDTKAIKKSVGNQALHCAEISNSFKERIRSLETRADEDRQRSRKA